MHTRDATSQKDTAAECLPPRVGPSRSVDEEEEQCNRASRNGNQGSADDVARLVDAGVVGDRGVSEVMHAADGNAGKHARADDANPTRLRAGTNGDKSDDQDDDGNEEGSGGDLGGVHDLEEVFAVGQDDR